jgi:hypothetical protein
MMMMMSNSNSNSNNNSNSNSNSNSLRDLPSECGLESLVRAVVVTSVGVGAALGEEAIT